jgi:hypothetical protein
MKRMVFSILMILALTTGAAFAQSTINTPAPGPTQQQEPGQTNNNLPNPGNPTPLANQDQQPVQEQGTVEGTATESMNDTQGTNTTGNVTGTTTGTTGTMNTTGTTTGSSGLANETETGSGMDVDVDTGSRAEGAVDVDVTSTTDADTDASGIDETAGLSGDTDTALPGTASELPLLGLIGLLALAAAFAVRRF